MRDSDEQPPSAEQTATTPSRGRYRSAVDQDWMISLVMELQRSCGVHETKLNHLASDMTEVKRVVARLEKVIYAAIVVVTLATSIGVWMINTAKEVALTTPQAHDDPPVATVPAPQPGKR